MPYTKRELIIENIAQNLYNLTTTKYPKPKKTLKLDLIKLVGLLGGNVREITNLIDLNPNQREAKKQKKAKGTLNGGLTVSEAESALLALARSLPVVCAGVFTFAIPALNSSVFWTAVAVSVAYGFFRECWIRASEVDWRAVYPSSRLAVAGRIIPNAMSFFCSYITVTLAIWLVSAP